MRVGSFKKRAGAVIREIRRRGKVPILVGGTHYYTQSLVFGDVLVGGEGKDEEGKGSGEEGGEMSVEEINRKWPILEDTTENMLEKLREVDPVMADRWHPKDRRKIRRSLEIFLMSGKKASDIYKEQLERKNSKHEEFTGDGVDLSSTLFFWIHAESSVLKKRLDSRVDNMLQNGLLGEVKTMDHFFHEQESQTAQTIDRTRGMWISIGYKEFEPYLQALNSGTATEEEMKTAFELSIEQTKAATRQYARRQTRWIRLKLLPALKEENALRQLYLLDGTDVSQFENDVLNPAIKITEDFLAGKKLPTPETVCGAAKEILGENEIQLVKSEWPRKECEFCGVVAVTEVQWDTHLKSRRHRGLLKKMAKRARDGGRVVSNPDVGKENGEISSAEDMPTP
jgi:tRNA dimethylallyltransferase